MSLKICFITSCFYNTQKQEKGPGYCNGRKPSPGNKFGNFDFFLFTNDHNFPKHSRWDIIYISNDYVDNLYNFNPNHPRINVYRSRYPKFQGWKYLKDVMNKEYDAIFYIDVNKSFNEKHPISWNDYAIKLKESDYGIFHKIHPPEMKRKCAYTEVDEICNNKLASKEECSKMKTFLESKNTPINLIKQSVLTENNLFGYDPKNKIITNAFDEFFSI